MLLSNSNVCLQDGEIMEFKESDYLHIRRVVYGKESTPQESREYKIANYPSPVGFVKDWQDYATIHGYVGLKVEEKDRTLRYVI